MADAACRRIIGSVLILLHSVAAAPVGSKHTECSAVDLTNTDLSAADAATAFGIYLESVEPVEVMDDFPKIVNQLERSLSNALGGRWDIYTAGVPGMLSYAVPCVRFIELTGEAWVAMLCQLPSRRLPRCADLKVHAHGTLDQSGLVQRLRQRTGGAGLADALERDAAAHTFEPTQLTHVNGVAESAPSIALAREVLAATAISAIGPLLAGTLRDAFAARDLAVAAADAARASSACMPEQPGQQCVWGVAVESEPEGLHQCSAEELFDLRWPSLTIIVHRRACDGGGGGDEKEDPTESWW